MNKNRNDKNRLSYLLLLSRLPSVFLFFFVLNFQAQIFLSEGSSMYVGKENLNAQVDSLVSAYPKSKIYISSGVQLFSLDSERNYEIVEIVPSEKKKIKSAKHLSLKIVKPQGENKIASEIVSEKENAAFSKDEFSRQKSEVCFSFSGGLSKIYLPVSQFNGKQVFSSENYKTSLSFKESKLASVCFKTIELLTVQNKSAFSVRPPPFLA